MSVDLGAAREILVRGPNWLGDLVMSTPGLRALRQACPDARITLWVREGLESLLAGSPYVDRCLVLRRRRGWARGLLGQARAARQEGGYDLGLCLPDSFSSALIMRGAGAHPIVGYRTGGRGPLLDLAVPALDRVRAGGLLAREEHVLGLLRAIGIDSDGTSLSLGTSLAEEGAAERLLTARGLDDGSSRLVGLAPGAGYGPSKCWPPDRFAAVGDALAEDGARVLLLGSPGEAKLSAAVATAMRHPAIDLASRLDLGTLKAVVRRLALLVCNDAGARHVAVAFGVPCVVLFGPTSVDKTPLNLERVSVIERHDPCRPCYRRHCPIDHRCLTGIDVADVIRAARQRLGGEDFEPLRSSLGVGEHI